MEAYDDEICEFIDMFMLSLIGKNMVLKILDYIWKMVSAYLEIPVDPRILESLVLYYSWYTRIGKNQKQHTENIQGNYYC